MHKKVESGSTVDKWVRRAAWAATGLSQKEVAARAKVPIQCFSTYVTGGRVMPETEAKILAAFRELGFELGKRGLWRVSTEPRKPVSDAIIAAALA